MKPRLLVWVFIVTYTAFFSWYTILKHYAFLTHAYDLGIYDQALWSTLQGRLLYTTLYGEAGTTTFAHHFQPILLLILPIYAIYQSPETLLILQSFFLGLGALPLYWIAKKNLNEVAGLVFSALYLLYPALHGVNKFDFHPVALAVPFFLFCFHYTNERRYFQSALSALLALMCQEDVALTVVALAVYLFLSDRKKILHEKGIRCREFIFPLSLIVVSSLWLILSIYVICPYFINNIFYRYENPISDLLFDLDKKFLYVTLLLAPLIFAPLLSPSTFLITLPSFATILMTRYSPNYKIGFQYPYAITPFIFISAIYGIQRLMLNNESLKKILGLLMILGILFTLFISPTPLGITDGISGVASSEDFPKIGFHQKALEEVIKLIPFNASLSTQNNIFPHVSHRLNVHLLYDPDDEYVLIDTTSLLTVIGSFELPSEKFVEIVRNYELVTSVDGVCLYRKR